MQDCRADEQYPRRFRQRIERGDDRIEPRCDHEPCQRDTTDQCAHENSACEQMDHDDLQTPVAKPLTINGRHLFHVLVLFGCQALFCG